MSTRITDRMKALLDELGELRGQVEGRLALASGPARQEWQRLCARLPSAKELTSGFVTLGEGDLEEIKSKAARFAEILRGLAASVARSAAGKRPSGKE